MLYSHLLPSVFGRKQANPTKKAGICHACQAPKIPGKKTRIAAYKARNSVKRAGKEMHLKTKRRISGSLSNTGVGAEVWEVIERRRHRSILNGRHLFTHWMPCPELSEKALLFTFLLISASSHPFPQTPLRRNAISWKDLRRAADTCNFLSSPHSASLRSMSLGPSKQVPP